MVLALPDEEVTEGLEGFLLLLLRFELEVGLVVYSQRKKIVKGREHGSQFLVERNKLLSYLSLDRKLLLPFFDPEIRP